MYKKFFVGIAILFAVPIVLFICLVGYMRYTGVFFGPGNADFHYDVVGGYEVFHAGETSITDGNHFIVPENVIEIAWDDNYILAVQEYNLDSNYWIIDISSSDVYGPLSSEEYNDKTVSLDIDDDFQFVNPDDYYKENIEQ